jgi:hypothetical protein
MAFHRVGVRYCTEHHGIANEDMERCDFAGDLFDDERAACRLRQLGYRTRR